MKNRKEEDRKNKEERIKKRDEARSFIFIAGRGNRKFSVLKFLKPCPLILGINLGLDQREREGSAFRQSGAFCHEETEIMGSEQLELAAGKAEHLT